MSLDTIAFSDTYVCINNAFWQISGITIILCKYYIVISDIVIDFWVCFPCCLLWYYQRFTRIQEEKIELQKKENRKICVRDITFFAARPLSYVTFCCFFRLLSPFRLLQFCVEKHFCSSKLWEEGELPPPASPVSAALIQAMFIYNTFILQGRCRLCFQFLYCNEVTSNWFLYFTM